MKDPFPPCPDTIVKAVTPICETLGFTTLPKHFHEVVGAFLLYHVTNVYLSPVISPLLFPKTYRSFNKRNRINWDIHVVSLVQSTLICIVSLYAMFVDRERSEMDAKQRVWGYTGLLGMTQAFGAGYFLWDLMVSTQYLNIFGPGLLAHAICALCVFSLGFRPFVNYYAPTFLLYELSSPFLNFHWFMDKLEMTGSTLQLVNGICLLVVFFSCRLVYGTYSSFRVGSDIYLAWQNPPLDIVQQGRSVPAWLALSYVTSNLILHFLNFYWFGKMVDALRRRFDSTKSTVSSPDKKGIVVTEDEVSVEGTDLKIPTSSALHQNVARHRR
ncbi:hypothetical protein TWF106_004961 [Orbilia oligospora]|uniref:TLC domain-containing protein n=1 Tax=Orbilia oligospora TaxID=2813651 RepID=A0A6G1LWB6_ORBOL|nr:hypothetical protein TWF788_002207 [Orbilia oligospora]KAF3196423.1 hypothetical protein TWF106_004961 [Orbilia oligospora]KAF3200070.1 hypothetical protein TWF679_001059 [Orbilia oligospora]KAF3201441.1 hypothetical protein TWF191_003413 [Orbilia oligospora]KAF3235199.1 hypothetical protein TWF192_000787 [Orbilia oligospora]